jgi:Indigoidine synthase A like protein
MQYEEPQTQRASAVIKSGSLGLLIESSGRKLACLRLNYHTMNWRSSHRTLRPFSFSARRRQSPSNLLDSLRRDAPIDVHPEIQDSLAAGQPVVALESTIITHGMPQPINLETVRSVERIVRSTGAIPATIAMLGGRIKIGLEPSELEYLADTRSHPSIEKLSRRDIAPAIVQKKDGGTTCSATLIFAALAGIKASSIISSISQSP